MKRVNKCGKMAQEVKETPQKILRGERVSIPKAILKELNLREGDFVLVRKSDHEIRIVPAQVIERQS